jgi:hypothetical protein
MAKVVVPISSFLRRKGRRKESMLHVQEDFWASNQSWTPGSRRVECFKKSSNERERTAAASTRPPVFYMNKHCRILGRHGGVA